jgi:subfamily B ATP-binding cassette protein MsbA
MTSADELSWRQKIASLRRVAAYRPRFTLGLVLFGGLAAVLEGIGLGFIYPILEVAQTEGSVEGGGPVLDSFLAFYELVGLPFTLGYLIIGVGLVMIIRYTFSFLVAWLRAILAKHYEKSLRTRAFESALDARIGYFDEETRKDRTTCSMRSLLKRGIPVGSSATVSERWSMFSSSRFTWASCYTSRRR